MPTEVFGDMIYENYIFDAAKLIDICAIFQRPNNEEMQKFLGAIIENVFACQPKYVLSCSESLNYNKKLNLRLFRLLLVILHAFLEKNLYFVFHLSN